MLVKVSMQDFRDGEETIKVALRGAWEKKKAAREGRAGKTQNPVYQQPQQEYSSSSFQ